LLGVKTPTNSTDDNDGDDPTDNPENEVFELSTSQEKRAEQIANYFGVSKQRARLFVRDTRPKPRQPKTDANADPENQLAKRTIRVPNDTDDLITRVARTTNRSYAVVANELFEVGRRVFVRRYDLNE
jgi:hypothetical protein